MSSEEGTVNVHVALRGGSDEGAKTRDCLRCSSSFESEWPGERICHQCKASSTWKNDEPYRRRKAVGEKVDVLG